MIADPITHYMLDAMILVLATVRYLWGSLTNLTRLGIVLCFVSLSLGNLDSYYKFLTPDLSPGGPAPRITGKLLLLIFIVADLLRDYILESYEENFGNWPSRKRKTR